MPKAITVGNLRKSYTYHARPCDPRGYGIQPARLTRRDEDGVHHELMEYVVLKLTKIEAIDTGKIARRQDVFAYAESLGHANAIAGGLQATIGTDAEEYGEFESDFESPPPYVNPTPVHVGPPPTIKEMLGEYTAGLYNANALIPGAEPSVLDPRD